MSVRGNLATVRWPRLRALLKRVAIGPVGLVAFIAAAALVTAAVPAAEVRSSRDQPGARDLHLDGIDPAIKPGDDFFAFANGGWLRATQIPADRSSYGTGAMVAELTLQRTLALLQKAAADPRADGQSRQIGDYFATFMDEAAIEQRGALPLRPVLARIAGIATRRQLAHELGTTLRTDVDLLNNTQMHTPNVFGLWVAADLDEPTRYVPILAQGGLEMPDRDYYLSQSASMAAIRDQYRAHIAAVLRLAGIAAADAVARASAIYDLESRIAAVHWSRVDSEQVRKGNNHWQRQEFERRAPGLDWHAYFGAAGLQKQSEFMVWQPSAVQGIAALVDSQPLPAWKDYLAFHAVEHASPYLSNAFVQQQFAFHGTVLQGTPQLRPRWKRAVDETNTALGEAVGQLYAAQYFPPAEKARAEGIVRNLVAAFATRIDNLKWMAPETRRTARAKLATLHISVGYPDKWRRYSGLEIVKGDAWGNAERAAHFDYQRNLARLGTPVDRAEWVMTPQTVNAVNLPVLNAINIPAGILQPPFFDPSRPLVMDYGSTGATIGHEISHSFDDQGALFDASGRLRNWWTGEDFAHFEASAAQLVGQFNGYRPFPDLAVNGTQTLSENVADVAGLAAAYDAYRIAMRVADGKAGDPRAGRARSAHAGTGSEGGSGSPEMAGFTADQLFFVSFAQSWRTKFRDAALRQRLVTDGHAPAEYRADTVRNLDPWYAAFDVKPGQALYLAPPDRVRMW